MSNEKRVLVISDGGSRGAWGGGQVKAIYEKESPDYQCVVGTSTGSLLAPHSVHHPLLRITISLT